MTTENPSPELEKQMHDWVAGNPVHVGTKTEGTCCPDFSCCKPELLWSKERREFFRDHPKARMEMLFQSLSDAVSEFDTDVYITGDA